MMKTTITYEEASHELNFLEGELYDHVYYDWHVCCDEHAYKCFLIAEEAVKKQIPQKPIDSYHCPNCEVGICIPPFAVKEYRPFARFTKYCEECGQALDWSEYEK